MKRNFRLLGPISLIFKFSSSSNSKNTNHPQSLSNRFLSTTKCHFNRTTLSQFIVVVSRFEEPSDTMTYLKQIPHLIYSRGMKSDIDLSLNITSIHDENNQGRESSVYLKYIIDHYETSPQVIIFSQADPVHTFDVHYSQQFREADILQLYRYISKSRY
jgi:hypothetical protein